jgi:hypothetical protein
MRSSYRVSGAAAILVLTGAVFLACVGDEPSVAPIAVDDAGGADSATSNDAAGNDGTTPPVDGGDAGVASDAAPNATGTVTFAVKVIADNIFGNAVKFDGLGNVVFGGTYMSATAVDFGNGKSLPANTGYDGFIAKYDATGKCVWVVALTGVGMNNRSVAALAAAPGGEIVFAADTGGSTSVKLDAAAVAGLGGNDVALGRLDAAGKQVFLRTLASPNYETPEALAVDPAGRIALAGRYIRDTPAFDPAFDGVTANPPAHTNPIGYVALLNPQGFTQALRAFPNSDNGMGSSVVSAHAVAFAPDGTIVVGGEFTGAMDLRYGEAASQIATSAGNNDAWIVKLDTTMNKISWATAFGGTSADNIHAISIDPSGNVTAAFNYGTAITISGTGILPTPSGFTDIGIVRFDPNGGMAAAYGYGSSGSDVPSTIVVDRWGEPIVAGSMSATISFGGKVATGYGGNGDGFIAKLSPTGAGLWAYGIGGSGGTDQFASVAVDLQGNVASTGWLQGEGNPKTLFGQTVNVGPGKNATFLVVTSP